MLIMTEVLYEIDMKIKLVIDVNVIIKTPARQNQLNIKFKTHIHYPEGLPSLLRANNFRNSRKPNFHPRYYFGQSLILDYEIFVQSKRCNL